MKTKILLLAIIAILTGSLVYEIVLRHLAWRNEQKFQIAVFVQLYQNLDRGEVSFAKQRLGTLVVLQSDYYLKQYGQERDAEFVKRLAEAKIIKTAMSISSK